MHGQVSMLLDLIPTVSESSGYKFDIFCISKSIQRYIALSIDHVKCDIKTKRGKKIM